MTRRAADEDLRARGRACVCSGVGNAQRRVGVDRVDTNIVPVWGAQKELVRSFIVKRSPREVNLHHPTDMVFLCDDNL